MNILDLVSTKQRQGSNRWEIFYIQQARRQFCVLSKQAFVLIMTHYLCYDCILYCADYKISKHLISKFFVYKHY